ncbi:MAG: glycosyltransferase family 39 protein [Planctomycetota bacterium]
MNELRTNPPPGDGPLPRAIPALVLLGVVLRLILVVLSGRSELQSDEANYVYLGLTQQHFGVLFDQYRYLWPPFYPWLLGQALAHFGTDAGFAVQLLQAVASASIGASIAALTWRLGSARAAIVATALWAVHLPLGGYTHLLWSETLFLALFTPALERLLAALQTRDADRAERRLLVAGLLLGASLWVKSFALYLTPVLALLVMFARRNQAGTASAVRGGTVVVLAAFVVTLPWTLRNIEVYGRPVMSGATLGENAYVGINARYMNFDYVALRRVRAQRDEDPIGALASSALVRGPERDGVPVGPWSRADEMPHTVRRQEIQVERALDFARAHPLWALRTRLKHVADLVTPLSFPTRHAALGLYGDGALGRPLARYTLVLLSLVTSVIVLGGAAVGVARGLRARAGALVVLPVLGYVVASSLVLSMSRIRLPAEPLLIVLAALALTHALEPIGAPRRERGTWVLAGVLLAALLALWGINGREVYAVVHEALQGGAA